MRTAYLRKAAKCLTEVAGTTWRRRSVARLRRIVSIVRPLRLPRRDGYPDLEASHARAPVEARRVALEERSVDDLVSGFGEPRREDAVESLSDGCHVVAMLEHGVPLRSDAKARELRRHRREILHLHAAQIVHVAVVVGVVADAIRILPDLRWNVPQVRGEALPLQRDGCAHRAVVALAGTGDEQGASFLNGGRRKRSVHDALQSQGRDECQTTTVPLSAYGFRGDAELISKGARECLVRPVTVIERDGENVVRSIDEPLRRFRQSAPSQITLHRLSDERCERSREVEARDLADLRQIIQSDFLFEVTLDVPKGFADRIHVASSRDTAALCLDRRDEV